jgi:pimeloyl-ACP methyl ester carboxylesterase
MIKSTTEITRTRSTFPLAAALLFMIATGIPAVVAAPADRGRFDADRVDLTRHFAPAGDLQVHYRRAAPVDPEAVRHRPVVCLHQSPNSSQVYVEFMAALAADRLVFAPDTPGFGESDIPASKPDIALYAKSMEEFTHSLDLGPVDLVAYHTGASIAIEWARSFPERVNSLVLVGLPAYNAEERAKMLSNPWPVSSPISSEYLSSEWEGSKSWQGEAQSDRSVERTFMAKIGAGRTAWWGPAAVFEYPLLEHLVEVSQPLTIVRAKDGLWDVTPRARAVKPKATYIDLPEYRFAVFEIAPERLATIARQRFDGAE